MIICERCGAQNGEGDSFCGQCNAFLEWDGTPATPKPPAPPVAPTPPVTPLAPAPPVTPAVSTTVPAETRPAETRPINSQATPNQTTPNQTTPTRADGTRGTETTEPRTEERWPSPDDIWPSPPTDQPTSVSPTPVSPAPVTPAPVTPTTGAGPVKPTVGAGPVKPGEAIRRRPTGPKEVADEPPPNAGDLICGQCGVGNEPTRKFCRRCGSSLLTAAVVPQPSWWRRLLNKLRGRRYEAGYRRQVRQPVRIHGRVIVVLMLAAMILLIAFPGRPYVRLASELVKDRIRDHVTVTPTAVRASSAAKGAAAGQVVDTFSNKYWAPAPAGSGEGQWIEVDLPDPTRVVDLVIYTGVSADKKQFLEQARPREVQIAFTDDVGKVSTKVIKLRDEPGKQAFQFGQSRVVKIRITLRTAYGATPTRRVAVAELEVFGRE